MNESSRLETLRRRVEADPASLAFAALAEEYRRARRLDDAIDTARKGLARHPTYVSARVTLGRALLDARRYDAACDELQAAIQAAPENLAALRALVEALRACGAHDRALEVLRRASATFPQDRELALLHADVTATAMRHAPLSTSPPPPPSVAPAVGIVVGPDPPPSAADVRRYRQIEALERFLFALARERSRREHAAAGA